MKTPEEVKKELDQIAYRFSGWLEGETCKDALAYIQHLEAKVPMWIGVGDRMPEYGRYLVVTEKPDDNASVHTATYNEMGWWTYANFGDITHWMPLPEPPEEETHETTD